VSADAATLFVPFDVRLLRSSREATRATFVPVVFPPRLAMSHLLQSVRFAGTSTVPAASANTDFISGVAATFACE